MAVASRRFVETVGMVDVQRGAGIVNLQITGALSHPPRTMSRGLRLLSSTGRWTWPITTRSTLPACAATYLR